MSSDYKYDIQLLAEELAEEKYGVEYFDLVQSEQVKLYEQAYQIWRDDYANTPTL